VNTVELGSMPRFASPEADIETGESTEDAKVHPATSQSLDVDFA